MKNKLLIVTDVMAFGGVEKVIVNVLNGLNYSKFDVTLFIMYKTEGENYNLSKIPNNVKIQYLFKKPVKGIYQRIFYYLLMLSPSRVMNTFIVKEDYDIIVTTKEVFTYPVSASKCQKIMWIHGGLEHLEIDESTVLGRFKRWFRKLTYSKFDKIILLTNAAKNRFCSKYNLDDRCYVINNPINSHEILKFSNERISDYEFGSEIILVCSCRLSVEKGVDRLINSCAKLLGEGYDFKLIILGDGPERVRLNEIIVSNNVLKERVAFLGFKLNPYKYMKKCSIYVSPSLTEGFPLSVAEAIILELPVLSTYCNGPAEILDNGNYGLLVDNSEYGIYEGLKEMLSRPELIQYYKLKSKERKTFLAFDKNVALFEGVISRADNNVQVP